MKRSFRSVLVIFAVGVLGATLAAGPASRALAAKGKKGAPAAAASDAPKNDTNPCGCYRGPGGACFCAKKAKCGCPGECEPKGCEEKRDKEIEKEIAAETKRAAEADKKQRKTSESADSEKPAKARPKKP